MGCKAVVRATFERRIGRLIKGQQPSGCRAPKARRPPAGVADGTGAATRPKASGGARARELTAVLGGPRKRS